MWPLLALPPRGGVAGATGPHAIQRLTTAAADARAQGLRTATGLAADAIASPLEATNGIGEKVVGWPRLTTGDLPLINNG